jgi:hypothetical protein
MSNAEKVERLRAKAMELHAVGQFAQAQQVYRRILDIRHSDLQARYMIACCNCSKVFRPRRLQVWNLC